MSTQTDNGTKRTGRNSVLNRKWEFLITLIVTIVTAGVANHFISNIVETIIFTVIAFIGCPLLFTWFKFDDIMPEIVETIKNESKVHDDNLDEIKDTLKLHAKKCKNDKTNVQLFMDLPQNFGMVSDKYEGTKSAFIVELYREKCITISNALGFIKDKEWFKIDTDMFRRYKSKVFVYAKTPEEKKEDYFCGVTYCGAPLGWFISSDGRTYIERIDATVREEEIVNNEKKRAIKRVFIYDPNEEITFADWIFIQLHKNSNYQIKMFTINSAEASLEENDEMDMDFAVYRKSFVWKKMPNAQNPKEGLMSVHHQHIQEYIRKFDEIWKQPPDDIPVPRDIVTHCGRKPITKLQDVLNDYKRAHPEVIDKHNDDHNQNNSNDETQVPPPTEE